MASRGAVVPVGRAQVAVRWTRSYWKDGNWFRLSQNGARVRLVKFVNH